MRFTCKRMDAFSASPICIFDPADCIELGVKDNERVRLVAERGEITVLAQSSEHFVERGIILLPDKVVKRLGVKDGDTIDAYFSPAPESVRAIRRKMDNEKLEGAEIDAIVKDIYAGRLSHIEISSWLTSLYINGMDLDEIAEFTKAMVNTGDRVPFDKGPIFDFHSIGGVPGNKITPIVVSIVAAAGLLIPKTSSRAISSACGTSDFVETFCDINVSADRLKEIGESVGGAFVWGGSMNLAPVDDIVIRIEHPLGINPRPQMLASILSKKLAINANYLLVDIPTGAGTKVPTIDLARSYARGARHTFKERRSAIGPNLEARECIRILEGEQHPASVIEKACECAGILLEMGGFQNGVEKAHEIRKSGKAHKKFMEIVVAQGGRADLKSSDLEPGKYSADILSTKSGYVHSIKNKDLVSIAKACGAPTDKGAGMLLLKKKGQRVEVGDVLFTLYADNEAKLQRAKDMAERYSPVVIEGMLIKRVAAPQVR